MHFTEIEACVKICPMSENLSHTCIGSKCMAWRWVEVSNPSNGVQRFYVADNPSAQNELEAGKRPEYCKNWQFMPCIDEPAGWLEPKSEADLRRQGYCGLAS
jgi:hypothetical protein